MSFLSPNTPQAGHLAAPMPSPAPSLPRRYATFLTPCLALYQ